MYIEVAYFVELSEFNYCIYGIIPEYASSKTYFSAEAQLEIDAVQDYVAALAEYDLHHPGGVALAAALYDGKRCEVYVTRWTLHVICFSERRRGGGARGGGGQIISRRPGPGDA